MIRNSNQVNLKFTIMKKISLSRMAVFFMIISGLFLPGILKAQDETQERIMNQSKEAKAAFVKADFSAWILVMKSVSAMWSPYYNMRVERS